MLGSEGGLGVGDRRSSQPRPDNAAGCPLMDERAVEKIALMGVQGRALLEYDCLEKYIDTP